MTTFTLLHVLISFVGIASGFVVLGGLLAGRRLEHWTEVFLVTTIATSATGFGFPFEKLLPSHVIGGISLVILALAVYALYARGLAGRWRLVYVISVVAAQYLNFFVLVVQAFLKVPVFHDAAPTQSEPAFAITQLVVLACFVALGYQAATRFRPETAPPR
jgi:hypothetical protein